MARKLTPPKAKAGPPAVVLEPKVTANEWALALVITQPNRWIRLGRHPRYSPMWWYLRRRGCEVAVRRVDGAEVLYARWTHGVEVAG